MGLIDWLRPRQQVAENSRLQASRLIDEGNVLEDAGEPGSAQQRYVAAIALAPEWPKAHLNLGNVLLASGDLQGASDSYRKTLELDPEYAPAHYNLGNVLALQHQAQAAIACYHRALQIKADFVDAQVALGNAQAGLGLWPQAVASYQHALTLRPDYLDVCRNLALALYQQNDLVAALGSLEPLLAARPDDGAAVSLAYQFTCHLCQWSDHDAIESTLRDMVRRGVPEINPFSLLTLEPWGDDTALLQRQASLQYAQKKFGSVLPLAPTFKFKTSHPPAKRLRIGYLSADFHDHATLRLLKGVLAAHDHEKFAIHGYSYGPSRDAITDQAQQACDIFRDMSKISYR